jgi:hypothetical protein
MKVKVKVKVKVMAMVKMGARGTKRDVSDGVKHPQVTPVPGAL